MGCIIIGRETLALEPVHTKPALPPLSRCREMTLIHSVAKGAAAGARRLSGRRLQNAPGVQTVDLPFCETPIEVAPEI
jgi:hypothetical protein